MRPLPLPYFLFRQRNNNFGCSRTHQIDMGVAEVAELSKKKKKKTYRLACGDGENQSRSENGSHCGGKKIMKEKKQNRNALGN